MRRESRNLAVGQGTPALRQSKPKRLLKLRHGRDAGVRLKIGVKWRWRLCIWRSDVGLNRRVSVFDILPRQTSWRFNTPLPCAYCASQVRAGHDVYVHDVYVLVYPVLPGGKGQTRPHVAISQERGQRQITKRPLSRKAPKSLDTLKKSPACAGLSCLAPEQRQQDNDRKRDTNQPQQRAFTKTHNNLLCCDRNNVSHGSWFPLL